MTSFTCLKCGRSTPAVEPSGEHREPVCQSCHERPTPGPNQPGTHEKSDEHEQLEQAIRDYINSNPDDADAGIRSVYDIFATVTSGYQRDRFVNGHNLSEPAETACIARLIGGHDECPHELFDEDDDPHAPAHSPPVDDHATLWLDEDGDPAMYSMHVYQGDLEHDFGDGPDNRWFDIVDFARHHGLEIGVRDSWYNPGGCQQIVFYPPE